MKRFSVVPLIMFAILFIFNLGCEPDDPDDPWPPPNIAFGEMTDTRDGQKYKTIEIGTQTWMAENLNFVSDSGNSWCNNNDTKNCDTYGRLYDWETALTVCPSGWHLPSDPAWSTLTDFLGGESVAGGKMKSTSGLWVSPNTGATNESGWSGLPGGYGVGGIYNFFSPLGYRGYWWSSTEDSADTVDTADTALKWFLRHDQGNIYRILDGKIIGNSVRCVRDKGPYSISGRIRGADVEVVAVFLTGDDADSTRTDSLGNYTLARLANGTYTITPKKKGYTFSPPNLIVTISGSDITGIDFTAETENPLNPDTTYGEFTDERDDQTYKTIEIGTQTWMAENLNFNTGNSWCYDDDPANCKVYGRLYDWNTAMNACPPGWHLPSDPAWTTLTDSLGRESVAGGKMKSTSGLWESPNTGATNESGWSGLPGGFRKEVKATLQHKEYYYYRLLRSDGFWWTSTTSSPFEAWKRSLSYYYNGSSVRRSAGSKGAANVGADWFSVRCLRD